MSFESSSPTVRVVGRATEVENVEAVPEFVPWGMTKLAFSLMMWLRSVEFSVEADAGNKIFEDCIDDDEPVDTTTVEVLDDFVAGHLKFGQTKLF